MRWIVCILFFAALLADVYIYRSVICSCFRRLPARVSYIIFAAITDGAALASFAIYGFAAGHGSEAVMAVMWTVWAFFITAFPKLLFSVGGFFDWLLSLALRRRIILFRPIFLCLSVVVVAAMIYGATSGRTEIRINEVEICSERVPAGFDGYRIVQFSDVHIGTMPNARERISDIAKAVSGLEPDLVVNTGDLVNISHRDLTPDLMSRLSRITAPDGVWSVWGNHDLGIYIKDTVSLPLCENLTKLSGKVSHIGWRILLDESVYLHRAGDSILLSGVNYPDDSKLNGHNSALSGVDIRKTFSKCTPDDFSIVLSHAPQLYDEIVSAGFGDLTLSGHVHSMQFKMRVCGRSLSPAQFLYEKWSGLYVENNFKKTFLYVNDGIGCVGYPMRIGAAPELTLFILKRCE